MASTDTRERRNSRATRTALLHGIYALVEPERREPVEYVRAILAGGVRLVQIRAKNGIPRALLGAIVDIVRAAGGITIVNDDVDAAGVADGVHLGQEDLTLHDLDVVRRRLGSGIVGISCGTPAEARAADPLLVDYIGVGPLFATGSKADAGLPIGINGARAVVSATPLPTAVIGGIDLPRLRQARETGAAMAAVVSALAGAPDPQAAARAMVTAWTA